MHNAMIIRTVERITTRTITISGKEARMRSAKSISRAQKRDMRRKNGQNIHHVIPRALGHNNSPDNLIVIDRRWHSALHRVFATDHPKEYLLKASEEPYEYARRWVRALVHEFGTSILVGSTE